MAHVVQEHNRLISSREPAGNSGKSCASQPPADPTPVHSVVMHPLTCAAISWALDQDVSSASASRLLIEIARRSHGGRCAATQKALGEACKLSERQTRTLKGSTKAGDFQARYHHLTQWVKGDLLPGHLEKGRADTLATVSA